ncbi:MAG: transglutaminase family protein [Pseudomonadota bacterium]
MTIQVALTHRTTYRYDRRVHLGPQIVRLRPAPHCRTRVLTYSLKVEPENHFINWQQDPYANWQARFVFQEPAEVLAVGVDLVAEMAVLNPFDFFVESAAEMFPFAYEPELRHDLVPFLKIQPQGPEFERFMAGVPRHQRNTVDFLVDLNQSLRHRVEYLIRMEPGVQTPENTLARGAGSCRDSSWLLVQVLRHLGLAARFVSGYLIQLKADQPALDGPSGTEADFTDLHAWCEVYLPGAGWIGFDPTSGLLAGEGHLPLAATPDPGSAAPIFGTVDNSEVQFAFDMKIERIREDPRVTLPYSSAQWAAIDGLGRAIDDRLRADDVRLTVGGEPTFVGIDDRDEDEWNTAAVGPTKRGFADDLIRRLRRRFAPDGLLTHGQGKWYPGEPLPRWSFALYWRTDGVPLWEDVNLLAEEAATETASATADIDDATAFAHALCSTLDVDPSCAQPVYEDPGHFLLQEHQLPPGVSPGDAELDEPEARRRLAAVLDRGLGRPTGLVLPLQAWQAKAGDGGQRRTRWRSDRWQTRRGHIFLIPGDSPVGFRLPLGSLAGVAGDEQRVIPMDPFAARGALPARDPSFQPRSPAGEGSAPVGGPPPEDAADLDAVVRTALTIEPRDGVLRVFLPPTESADAFVELVRAIERSATGCGLPVRIEGYPPPTDPRLNVIKVTPDPGVVEVNVQPSHSWDEQVEITGAVYEEARLARLDTAKFMLDGRPAGTGGGNHVVVGGPTPADSPFLRRPDLLASLIRYWQNHPSLSFLFSGLFIGPTSQAPRIDEARDDQLVELEIALAQVPNPTLAGPEDCPPWLVDRLFRNLLVDVTGNTHRAEICIDKLYNPEGPAGRLGLIEFRAFEMPPHPWMSLAQQLVLRGLVAWFWRQPYTRPLTPFGLGLHDRFMLPHYVWEDFTQVLGDLALAGMAMDPAWFAPHFEFRFPLYGHVDAGGLSLELRAALEPWHVLGEQGAAGGTARYVDSSLERLQAKVTGAWHDRHVVTCNGYALPLRATATGDGVCGVRFRAWQPPSCLHPTIGVHAPLVFDVVDTTAGRSVGGCTYHVTHPAGRNYETAPVNDFEAQGRRMARFQVMGHTPGATAPKRLEPHPGAPCTLDLRRAVLSAR